MLHGFTSHRSIFGSFFTVILISIALTFTASKLAILVNYKDLKLTIWQYDNYLDYSFEFSTKEFGYNVAFNLVSDRFHNDFDVYDDPDYGELVLQEIIWGSNVPNGFQ